MLTTSARSGAREASPSAEARASHALGELRFLEGFGDLLRDRERLVDGDGPALQPFGQILALDQLHRQEVRGRAVGERRALEAVEVCDAGVVEGREDLCLALEAGEAVGVGGECLGQELESHVAAELRVGGAVNLAHPARAERRDDLVRAEAGAGGERHAATLPRQRM